MRCMWNKNEMSWLLFGSAWWIFMKEGQRYKQWPEEVPGQGVGLFCASASSRGFQEFWACLGEGLKRKRIPETLSTQAEGAGFGASMLCLWPLALPAFAACTALSFHATISSTMCQELGFLHWSNCPQPTLAAEFGAGEKEVGIVFFSYS